MENRGYYGIGIENCKNPLNLGTLWRTAQSFGAAFCFVVGDRYKVQKSDTGKAFRHLPFFEYKSLEDWKKSIPRECTIVGLEYPAEKARPLSKDYIHPERAIYLLGAEDTGLSQAGLSVCNQLLYIPAKQCLNVATAGSIIMYDRCSKNKGE